MKTKSMIAAMSAITILATSPIQAVGQRDAGQSPASVFRTQQNAALTSLEEQNLVFMREEEKLARDVYLTLFEKWQHPVFSNISSAEQRHMDALKTQLEKYRLQDPVLDDTVGVFTNEELAQLYNELTDDNDLTDQGLDSLQQAFYTGALIEEIDIRDLEVAIDETSHSDLVNTYENLLRGSRNHLRAFVGQIENLGVVYEAQELNQTAVDAIVNSAMERGGKRRKGKGRR